jgi:hypothetical protein
MNWNFDGSDILATTMAKLWQNSGQNDDQGLSSRQRVKLLAQSLSALARELEATLCDAENGSGETSDRSKMPALAPMRHAPVQRADLGDMALKAYRDRRRRAEVFGDETLFGEPAWDILLDLFVAGEKGKRVAVTSACIGSGVPSTTALRWLNVLELRGLVEREDDNADARRSFVRLTSKARGLMVDYFGAGRG